MSEFDQSLALFQAMQHRLDSKRPKQWDLVNVLPPDDVDFDPYFDAIIPENLSNKPKGTRRDIAVQKELLRWHRRGEPEILALHMLFISYLRRDSKHTAQAQRLFFRLWDEKAEEMLEILPLREQISVLRTFVDHASDTQRRLSAKMGYLYISLISAYETERLSEGLSAKEAGYQLPLKGQDLPFGQLRRARFALDDSVEIINLMLAEEVLKDGLIGAILLNILLTLHSSDNLFTRIDQARRDANLDVDMTTFWSFGFDGSKISLDDFLEDEIL